MTKQEFLEKVENKPKKTQILIQWNQNGSTANPQTMIYSGSNERYFMGINTRGQQVQGEWTQVGFITVFEYFKPDIMTKSSLVHQVKYPSTKDRYVGVEMEIISKMDQNAMASALALAGLEEHVNVTTDGSVQRSEAHPFPHELRILAKEKEFARVIKGVCKVLHGKATVNKSCGLHVHLDMRHRDSNVAYANLFASQALLYAMCPKTRLGNNYCKPTTAYTKMETASRSGDRYYGINASSFERHKTIEIRIHSGSVNAFKIINWIKLLIQIADKPTDNVERVAVWRNYRDTKRMIGLRGMLEKYVSSRIEEFAEDHEESQIRLTA